MFVFGLCLVCVWLFFSYTGIEDTLNNSVTVVVNQLLFLLLPLTHSVARDKLQTPCLSFFSCEIEKGRLRHAGLVFSKGLAVTQDT